MRILSLLASRFSLLFSILWRLSILILPWQTRWIFEQGMVAGFRWESATASFYASWIVFGFTIVLSTILFWNQWKAKFYAGLTCETDRSNGLFHWIAYLRNGFKEPTFKQKVQACFKNSVTQTVFVSLIAIACLLPTTLSVAPAVSLLWWGNVIILGLLFGSFWIAQIRKTTLVFWFVLSLIPHAGIGLVQYFTQDALGSTIFGMAVHHPWIAGTSVIEHGLYRVLRAYGGFPHPNILGGWLVVGLTMLPFLIPSQKNSFGRIFLSLTGFLFSCVLIFTYSRSAWIAVVIGLTASVWWLWKSLDEIGRLRIISFLIVVLASIGVAVGINWDHVGARFHPDQNRLEAWSIESRSRSMQEGLEAFNRRQIAGWGQGTSLIASIVARTPELKRHPILILVDPEPAHNVPQVILVEMGLFGLLGVIVLLGMVYRFCSKKYSFTLMQKKWTIWIPHPLLFVLLVLACLDHYLWTLWAGQSLVMVGLLMASEEG